MDLSFGEQQVQTNERSGIKQYRMLTQILKVYVLGNIKLITEAAARALSLLDLESYVFDNKKYYVVPEKLIKTFEAMEFEIEYIELKFNKEKNKVLLLSENDGFYIDLSSLNILNTIDSKKLDFDKNKYGPLTHNELDMFKTNYNVNFVNDDSIDNDISEFKKI